MSRGANLRTSEINKKGAATEVCTEQSQYHSGSVDGSSINKLKHAEGSAGKYSEVHGTFGKSQRNSSLDDGSIPSSSSFVTEHDAVIVELPGPGFIGWQHKHHTLERCPGRCRTPEHHYAFWRSEYDYHLRVLYALTKRSKSRGGGDLERFARFVYKHSSGLVCE